jgi:hypothetical protein
VCIFSNFSQVVGTLSRPYRLQHMYFINSGFSSKAIEAARIDWRAVANTRSHFCKLVHEFHTPPDCATLHFQYLAEQFFLYTKAWILPLDSFCSQVIVSSFIALRLNGRRGRKILHIFFSFVFNLTSTTPNRTDQNRLGPRNILRSKG